MSTSTTNLGDVVACGNICSQSGSVSVDDDLKLIGNIIFNTTPSNEDVLTFTGGKWQAAATAWVGSATSNLEMDCYSINNVDTIRVGNVFGKSPINIHDDLNFRETNGNTMISFPAGPGASQGIQIGSRVATTLKQSTFAEDYGCVAIGHRCVANVGFEAISIGFESLALNTNAIAIGCDARAPGKSDICIGSEVMSNTKGIASSGYNVAIGRAALSTIEAGGTYNVAIGSQSLNNISTGSYNTAIGGVSGTSLDGQRNVAVGWLSLDSGGQFGNDRIAIGSKTRANGSYSISIGSTGSNTYSDRTITNAERAIAIGNKANAQGEKNIALGYSSTTNGISSIAIGNQTSATMGNTIAIGTLSQATAANVIAIGFGANSSTVDAIVLGSPSPTNGTATATAWGQTFQDKSWADAQIGFARIDGDGNLVKDNGDISIPGDLDMECNDILNVGNIYVGNVFGKSPINVHDTLNIKDTALGGNITFEAGIQIGSNSQTSADGSIAIGRNSLTVGDFSIAIGGSSEASDAGAIGIGVNTMSTAIQAVAIGNNAEATTDSAVAIGHNASATTGVSLLALGANSICTGDSAIAVGVDAVATQESAIALGNDANATAVNAIAIGETTIANAISAIAIGRISKATNHSAIAIGGNANATATNSIAIGGNASVSNTGSIALGCTADMDNMFGARAKTGPPGQACAIRAIDGTANDGDGFEFYYPISSIRFKKDIRTLEDVGSKIDLSRPVRYKSKLIDEGLTVDKDYIGFIAEELEDIFPEFVTYEGDGITPMGIDYPSITAVLMREIQSLRQRLSDAGIP